MGQGGSYFLSFVSLAVLGPGSVVLPPVSAERQGGYHLFRGRTMSSQVAMERR